MNITEQERHENLVECHMDTIMGEGIAALCEIANEYKAVNVNPDTPDYAKDYSRRQLDAIKDAIKRYRAMPAYDRQWAGVGVN